MLYAQSATSQLEWFASMNPIEHKVDNLYMRKTYVLIAL